MITYGPDISLPTTLSMISWLMQIFQKNSRYFEALSKGEPLPVKDRLEVPIGSALERPVTKGFIEVLHKQVLDTLSCVKF